MTGRELRARDAPGLDVMVKSSGADPEESGHFTGSQDVVVVRVGRSHGGTVDA